MELTLRHREVMKSGKRLVDALDEARTVTGLISGNSEDVTITDRWRLAREAVTEAAEDYAIALENYREAVVSRFARCRPRSRR